MKNKISKQRFYEILREEISAFQADPQKLTEDVDHATIATVTSEASKLLKAVRHFEDKATDMMKDAVVQMLPGLKQQLENMAQAPGSYVPRAPRKVIKLRATKDDD